MGRADPGAWEAAADQFRNRNEPYTTAYAEFRQAQALLLADGDRGAEEANGLLREARAITVELGERPLRAEIEALAQRIR